MKVKFGIDEFGKIHAWTYGAKKSGRSVPLTTEQVNQLSGAIEFINGLWPRSIYRSPLSTRRLND